MNKKRETQSEDTSRHTRLWPSQADYQEPRDLLAEYSRPSEWSRAVTGSRQSPSKRLTPLKWYGSKSRLTGRLVDLLPTHKTFVEVFGGAGAVLFSKPPSTMEVYNDIDCRLVEFFEVLRDKEGCHRLAELLDDTPYGREEYERCKARYRIETNPVERARQLYVLTHQSINGRFAGGWSRDRGSNRAKQFRNGLGLLKRASKRLSHVVIENRDFEELIHYYDSLQTLFYLDPPYLADTRTVPRRYDHEMTDEDHDRLLSIITATEGKVLLSGYAHPLYDSRLSGWDRIEIQVTCASSVLAQGKKRRPTRTEVIWANFDLSVRR